AGVEVTLRVLADGRDELELALAKVARLWVEELRRLPQPVSLLAVAVGTLGEEVLAPAGERLGVELQAVQLSFALGHIDERFSRRAKDRLQELFQLRGLFLL